MGCFHEHTQRGLVELRLPRQRPWGDIAAGHHDLDNIDPAVGTSPYGGHDVRGRRLRTDQEMAVPPRCRDRRAAGQDPGKRPILSAGIPDLDHGVVAVAEILHRGDPTGQSPAPVEYRLCSLTRHIVRESLHDV